MRDHKYPSKRNVEKLSMSTDIIIIIRNKINKFFFFAKNRAVDKKLWNKTKRKKDKNNRKIHIRVHRKSCALRKGNKSWGYKREIGKLSRSCEWSGIVLQTKNATFSFIYLILTICSCRYDVFWRKKKEFNILKVVSIILFF